MTPVLSVVLGTLDRLPLLMACLPSIRASVGSVPYEIIVVDGGSIDGTREFLVEQPDVTVIWQGARVGAIKAFNAGFEAARGKYVANFNDDAQYRGDTLEQAVAYLDAHPACGQVAIPFRDPEGETHIEKVTAGRKQQTFIYANFGVIRRWLGTALGWWGTVYYHYGGDTDLSLEVWKAGYTVEALRGGLIEHARVQDGIRIVHYSNRAFREKWARWSGDFTMLTPPANA